jgi:hypothetical protein
MIHAIDVFVRFLYGRHIYEEVFDSNTYNDVVDEGR